MHARQYAFEHRKIRRLCKVFKISAFAKQNGTSYSKLMGALRKGIWAGQGKFVADFAEFHQKR